MRSHNLNSGWFDACCFNLEHPGGLSARSPTTIASSVESIKNMFTSLRCKDRDSHQKCRSSDGPYSLQIGEKIIQSYKEHCMKHVANTNAPEHSDFFHLRLADAMTFF